VRMRNHDQMVLRHPVRLLRSPRAIVSECESPDCAQIGLGKRESD
jgi:hypothetical protein